MKDVVLVDLQENGLHSSEDYIKVLDAVISIPAMKNYLEKENIILIVADWPGQIFLRTSISRYLTFGEHSNIPATILFFLPIIGLLHISLNSQELVFLQYQPFFAALYKYIFGEKKPLAQKPKP